MTRTTPQAPGTISGRVDVHYRADDGRPVSVCLTDHHAATNYAAGVDRYDAREHRPALRNWTYRACRHMPSQP